MHSKGSRDPKPETRKVERPPYEQLVGEIERMGYRAVGRKYGVSDNAVRKWVRWYRARLDGPDEHQAEPGESPSGRDSAPPLTGG